MKSAFLFLSFYQNILCKNDFVVVKNVYFLENNFWDFTNQNQTDKGFLHRVAVYFENNRGNRCGSINITSFCHYLSLTNRRYTVFSDKMADYIDVFKKSSTTDQFILNFEFFFTDSVVNYSYLDEYYTKVMSYKTFKMLEKAPDKNDLRLESDSKEICIHFMKKIIVDLSKMKLLKIDEYISAMEEQFLEDKFKIIENIAQFKLYHFKNYAECLVSILRFVKNLDHLKSLIDDDVLNSIVYKFFVLPINTKPALKVSTFIDSLRKRFEQEKIENKKLTGFISRISELFSELIKSILKKQSKNIEFLIDACFDHINLEIMNNNIFLPINDKYNIDFYLLMLSNIIQNIVESILRIDDKTKPQLKDIIFQYQFSILDTKLKNLQDSVVKDLCKAKYFYHCFSKLLKRDLEILDDYKIIERMMCDYNNMLVFLLV
jgi:hypothetical protein